MRVTWNTRDFKKLLLNNGYALDRIKGDHFIYVKNGNHITVNRNINKMVAQRLIKENNLKMGE